MCPTPQISYEATRRCRRHDLIYFIGAILLRIQVNGEPLESSAATVLALVEELGLDVRKVAVERNLEIVPKSLHASTSIAEGDRIEVVQFVGGG